MSVKITEDRGEFIIEGECSLHQALQSIIAHLDRKADIQIKVAKISREHSSPVDQARAEVRARQIVDTMRLFADAAEGLPSSKKRKLERLDIPGEVRVED